MAKFAQSFYNIKNPAKYVGKKRPYARSSWETHFMIFLDENPSVVQWASEPLQIPYRNPVTNKQTVYVPDFLIVYVDQHNTQHAELVEIKPMKQSSLMEAKTQEQKMVVAVNYAKWEAAMKFCKQNGLTFRLRTEEQLFKNTPSKKRKK